MLSAFSAWPIQRMQCARRAGPSRYWPSRGPWPRPPGGVPRPAPAEDVLLRHAQPADADLAVVVAAAHRLDVAHHLPALGGDVDQEGRVRRLRHLGLVLRAPDQDRERRTA